MRPEPPTEQEVGAPLDLLLTSAALGRRLGSFPVRPALSLAGALVRRPRRVADQATALVTELVQVLAGTSELAPDPKDRRFADPAWAGNPALHRLLQSYLAAARTVDELCQDLGLPWHEAEQVRFAMTHLVEALSPSNNPLTNPAAWKEAIDTGGLSLARGARNLAQDVWAPPRVPTSVDRSAFTVGEDLAATPGAVVMRTPLFELIQYAPATPTVRREPVLVVPPTINKYYVLDLAPQRSMVQHLVEHGQQVFLMSWRNPGRGDRAWGMDEYAGAILGALATTEEIAAADRVHLLGCCSGGILASMVASHLQQTGRQHELASITLLVTMLDQAQAGALGAMTDQKAARKAIAASAKAGFVDGRKMAEVFALLRPADLIWNYWVNNYLLGRTPPAFDILAWNLDTIRMPARLHADFVELAVGNLLTRPDALSILGTGVDLSKVTVDAYVLAGIADHLCPWPCCFRSAQLFGGATRFVLSTSGHVAALVNPPGNPKAGFLAHDRPVEAGIDTADWQAAASRTSGSWWDDLVAWLADRSTDGAEAPTRLGSSAHPVVAPAPGSYVLQA